MIRILIITLLCGQFCSGQLKKEFLKTIKDSLPSDSWRICNVDSSFYKKDIIYLFKRVLNSKDQEEVHHQYDNCCKFITWNFIKKKSISQYEEERCGQVIKGFEISSETIKIKVVQENSKTILQRFWRNKMLDSFYITEIKNVIFSGNQKSKEITLIRIK